MSGFHAVRAVVELDAQASKAHAQHYARTAKTLFDRIAARRRVIGTELSRCAATLGEGWAPDFMALLDRANIVLWSQLNNTVTKGATPVGYATNRRLRDKYLDRVKNQAKIQFGKLHLKKVMPSPMKVVGVPLLGKKDTALLSVVLGWKAQNAEPEIRTKAEVFQKCVNLLTVYRGLPTLNESIDALLARRFPNELQTRYGIKSAFVGLLDNRGVLMRRSDGDTNNLFVGDQLAPKSQALYEARAQLHATTEIWPKDRILEQPGASKHDSGSGRSRPEILRVGFGPVIGGDNKLAGVLVVAWPLDVQSAHANLEKITGAQVSILAGKETSSTTLKRARAAALLKVKQTVVGPTDKWKRPKLTKLTIGSEVYVAAAGKMPRAGNDGAYSYVVLASVTRATQPFGYAKVLIAIFGAILILGFLVVSWLVRRYFILALDELENGVAAIVAGNMEYTFGVPSVETEGLAYSMNVLMAQLLGRPEPGEEDEEEGEGGGGPRILFSLGPLPDRAYRPGDSQLIPRLDEDRDTYYQRIFSEYLTAMQELGEETTGMDINAFRRKLEVNERMITARLKCSEVRFAVVPGDEEVVLQPYPVA